MDRDRISPEPSEPEGRPEAWSPKAVAGCLRALLIPALVLALLVGVAGYFIVRHLSRSGDRSKSRDNISNLVKLHLDLVRHGPGLPPPAVGGKAFVLLPLVEHVIDPDAPGAVELFFSPADRNAERPSVQEYRALTRKRLEEGADVRRFTSYVGRRVPLAKAEGTPARQAWPVIADLSYPDGAIVGYRDGLVQWLTREELGLGPDDPIVAGPTSKSPILRQLSE